MSTYKKLLSNLAVSHDSLVRRVVISFVLTFTVINIIIYLSWSSFGELRDNAKMVEHTHAVLKELKEFENAILDGESSVRGFALVQDVRFIKSYVPDRDSAFNKLATLHRLTGDNPSQISRINELDSLATKRFALLQQIINETNKGRFSPDDNTLIVDGERVMSAIKSIISQAIQEEMNLMTIRNGMVKQSAYQSGATIFIFSLLVIAIIVISLLVILSELKKRSALEALLKSILDASLNGIQSFESVRDRSGKIIDFRYIQANVTSYKIVAITPESYVGKSLLEIFPAIKAEGLFEKLVAVVETGKPLDTEHQFNYRRMNGWYRMVAVKMSDGFTLTFDNITQAKQTEVELKNNLEALRRSNEELEQFAYVASHDLQEPLRKILSFIDRLKLKGVVSLNENGKIYFERIENSALRMRSLISDLLSYSRTGNISSLTTQVDLNNVLTETLSALEVAIQQKNALITHTELPIVEGVEVQLQQLFQNIISNSLKFSDPDRAPVIRITSEYVNALEIETGEIPKANSKFYCRISFADNGVGFEDKYAEKIFQIFQRLHGRSEYEGTGIGLAICKKIADNHHGTIIANAKPGEGATFIITLPLRQNFGK